MSVSFDAPNFKLDRPVRPDISGHHRPPWLSEIVLNDIKRASTCGIVFASAFLAHVVWFGSHSDLNFPQAMAIAISTLISFYLPVADTVQTRWKFTSLEASRTLIHWIIAITPAFLISLIFRESTSASLGWVGLWSIYGLLGVLTAQILFNYQILRWRRLGFLTNNVVVVSAGEIGHRVVHHLTRALDSSDRIVAVIYDYEAYPSCGPTSGAIMDAHNDLLCFARVNRIDRVIVALPWHAEDRLLSWLKLLRVLPADVVLCPPTLASSLDPLGIKQSDYAQLIPVLARPLPGWDYITKAIEDRVLALLLLLLASPAMFLIALAVRLDSPGPVLFRQKRFGFNSVPFDVLKFRTMHIAPVNSNSGSIIQAKRGDPRVTRVGRWLRCTSLDELPQLINVLCGQMSLVGPRPHAIAHNVQYEKTIEGYRARHRVKPGITGWAQVNGLRGETDTDEKMARRVEYDLYYIEHWSLLFDFSIIARTAFVGFVNSNAY